LFKYKLALFLNERLLNSSACQGPTPGSRSVHRMESYLNKTYGSADSTWAGGSGVAGQVGKTGRGIVMYRDPSGGAGLNHVTAWSSGGKVALDGWFSTAPEGTTASYWSF
jgi:hypothetical protein